MDMGLLVRKHPTLFHLAEYGSWDSIARHGLLSTSALLDLFEIPALDRTTIESARRPDSIVIAHPEHGRAVVRDQKPLSESALLGCLHDMSPAEWYRLLNSRVFFWPTELRLRTLLGARACRGRPHTVISVQTSALLERHLRSVTISPINSGSTAHVPVRRGPDTFQSIADFPEHVWKSRGVAELTVNYAVPDILDVALSAEVWDERGRSQVLWPRAAECRTVHLSELSNSRCTALDAGRAGRASWPE